MSFRISSWKKKNSLYNVSSSLCHSLSLGPKYFYAFCIAENVVTIFGLPSLFLFVFCFVLLFLDFFLLLSKRARRCDWIAPASMWPMFCNARFWISLAIFFLWLLLQCGMHSAWLRKEEKHSKRGRRDAAYEVDDDRDDGPLTLVSCATESPVAVFLPRSSSHYGILTQPTLSPYTCSSFSPSFSLLLSIILSVCRHILQMRSSSVAAL